MLKEAPASLGGGGCHKKGRMGLERGIIIWDREFSKIIRNET
mgnify:CR=1 FL=1